MALPAKRSFLRLPASVDTGRLLEDFKSLSPSAWSAARWEVHASTRFVLLRGGVSGQPEDFTTDEPVDGPLLAKLPYLHWLLSPEGPFGKVRYAFLFSLRAGGTTLPHVDKAPVWKDLYRIHIPVVTHDRALLFVDGFAKHFQAGEVWTFDNQAEHGGINQGPERVHLIIDVAPCPKLEALVADAAWDEGRPEPRLWEGLKTLRNMGKPKPTAMRPAAMIPLDADVLKLNFGFDAEADIKRAVVTVARHTQASFERLATLWQQVLYLDRFRIPGALVECGVWRGGCVGLMAMAHMQSAAQPWREIHLFDSFEGLHQPDRRLDGDRAIELADGAADGKIEPIGACVAEQALSRQLLADIGYPEHLIHYHVGWFQETIPRDAAAVGPIALLRLDADWYEPTRIALDHLYPEVRSAGVVVVDDYGHFEGCRKAVDDFIAGQEKPILLNHIDYTARSWVKA